MSSIGAETLGRETEKMYNKAMKLTATQKKKLISRAKHYTGECSCSPLSKSCPYWKLIDKKGEDDLAKGLVKELEKL